MPKTKHENQPGSYTHFQNVNDYLKKNFALYAAAGEEIDLIEPEKTRGGFVGLFGQPTLASVKSAKSVKYTKVQIPNTNVALINREDEYHTAVWTTEPDNIKRALRSGFFNVSVLQNPLTKAIAQLGNYKRTVYLDRNLEEEGLGTAKTKQKLAIVDTVQDVIEAMQSLFLFINKYNDALKPEQNLLRLIEQIQLFENKIIAMQGGCPASMVNGLVEIQRKITTYRLALEARTNRAISRDKMKIILRPYNTNWKSLLDSERDLNLQHFIQNQMNNVIQLGIEANYTLSPFELVAPGNLSDDLLNAKQTAEDMSRVRVDYHNPFAREHAMDFTQRANEEGKVALNLSELGVVPEDMVSLARHVALMDAIDKNKEFAGTRLPGRGGVRWEIRDWRDPFRAVGRWLANAVFNTLGLFSGYFLELRRDLAKKVYEEHSVTSPLFQQQLTKLPQTSILMRAMRFLGTQIYRATLEPVGLLAKSIWTQLFKFQILDQLRFDRTIGREKINTAEIALLLDSRLSEDEAQKGINVYQKEKLLAQCKDYNKTSVDYTAMVAKFRKDQMTKPGAAIMPYHVMPDDPNDMISGAGNGFNVLFDVFSQEIYRAQPFGGLMFSLAAATAIPIAIPSVSQFALFKFLSTNVSEPVAEAVLGHAEGTVAATSVGLVLGKLAFLATNVGTHGKDSYLIKGLRTALQNPLVAGALGLSAFYVGYEVAFNLNVPLVSPNLADESRGSLSFIELSLSGAKMSLLVAESLIDTSKTPSQAIDESVKDMYGFITEHMSNVYCDNHNINDPNYLTDAQKKEIDVLVRDFQEQLKWNFKSRPEVADKYQMMLASMNEAAANANVAAVAAPPKKFEEDHIQLFLSRARIRDQIRRLNPETLSDKDKYKIMHYVTHEYQDQPEYVAAVKNKLYKPEKTGPLAESVRILISYPMALVRAVNAIGSSLYARAIGDKEEASVRLQPARDFIDKVRNDLGLLVKAGMTVARTLLKFTGAVLIAPLAIIGGSFRSLFYRQFEFGKTWSDLSAFLFSPGFLNRLIDTFVGKMRAGASAMHINMATDSINIIENKQFIADPQQYANDHAEAMLNKRALAFDKRDPKNEMIYLYSSFMRLKLLPDNTMLTADLKSLNKKLHDVRKALYAFERTNFTVEDKALNLTIPEIQLKSNEAKLKAVEHLLQQHDCLTLRSSEYIDALKKITQNPSINSVTKGHAKVMLHCFEELHQAAHAASHRLAVFPELREELVRLPEKPAPKVVQSTQPPAVSPSTQPTSVTQAQQPVSQSITQVPKQEPTIIQPKPTPASNPAPTVTSNHSSRLFAPAKKDKISIVTTAKFTSDDEKALLSAYERYVNTEIKESEKERYKPEQAFNMMKNEVKTRLHFKSRADAEAYIRALQSMPGFSEKFEVNEVKKTTDRGPAR